jgi:hypothetical protein
MMRQLIRLAVLAMAVTAFNAVPAQALESPAVCGGREIPLATDANGNPIEKLVEHTLYFHGVDRLGDVQGAQVILGGGTPFAMDPNRPTTTETKIKSSKPGVFGNDNFSQNPVNGYWVRQLDSEQRIVCAGTSVHALANSTSIGTLLFLDQDFADQTGHVKRGSATAPAGNGVRVFSGNFGALDQVVASSITVQFAPGPPGALLFYDSTEAPSSFTYVTVEPI